MSYENDIVGLVSESDRDEISSYIEQREEDMKEYLKESLKGEMEAFRKQLKAEVAKKTALTREEVSEAVDNVLRERKREYEDKIDEI